MRIAPRTIAWVVQVIFFSLSMILFMSSYGQINDRCVDSCGTGIVSCSFTNNKCRPSSSTAASVCPTYGFSQYCTDLCAQRDSSEINCIIATGRTCSCPEYCNNGCQSMAAPFALMILLALLGDAPLINNPSDRRPKLGRMLLDLVLFVSRFCLQQSLLSVTSSTETTETMTIVLVSALGLCVIAYIFNYFTEKDATQLKLINRTLTSSKFIQAAAAVAIVIVTMLESNIEYNTTKLFAFSSDLSVLSSSVAFHILHMIAALITGLLPVLAPITTPPLPNTLVSSSSALAPRPGHPYYKQKDDATPSLLENQNNSLN